MTETQVHEAVCEVLRSETGRNGPFFPETALVDQLGLDSLALLSLTVALENRFEVCLEPDEDEPLVSVGDVVRLLVRARAAGEICA